jgi:hypothetical protein
LRDELTREVTRFLRENKHLKTYSDGMIGWILSDPKFQHLQTINVTEQFHNLYHWNSKTSSISQQQELKHDNSSSKLTKTRNENEWLHSLLLKNASKYVYLFAPGKNILSLVSFF